MKLVFCQISTNLINKPSDTITDKYYNKLWTAKKSDGCVKPDDFWELPLWITEACYTLSNFEHELCIIRNTNQQLPQGDYYLFSVLDVNRDIVKQIIKNNPAKYFLLGGYTKPFNYPNITTCWFDNIEQLTRWFNKPYKYGTDYSLFKGFDCIPRLTLSTGCYNSCKFCTIEKDIKEKGATDIIRQMESFKDLNFKLVYVNDKTFGQANNYWRLKECYEYTKGYNPKFKGFIIQTTCRQVIKFMHENENLKALGIFAAELGIETFNDNILKALRKPQTETSIELAVLKLVQQDIKVIGNFIIGLPDENLRTYCKTINFIEDNHKRFYALNIYNLALYDNVELSKEVTPGISDKNELVVNRDFRTRTENTLANEFSNIVFKIGLDILN